MIAEIYLCQIFVVFISLQHILPDLFGMETVFFYVHVFLFVFFPLEAWCNSAFL